MGYSMRTPDWRYTAYLHFDKKRLLPLYDKPIFDEELYDHRFEKLGDFTHRETMNVISNSEFESVIVGLREKLLTFLKSEIDYCAANNILWYDGDPKNDPKVVFNPTGGKRALADYETYISPDHAVVPLD
jgi:hypothetical protein